MVEQWVPFNIHGIPWLYHGHFSAKPWLTIVEKHGLTMVQPLLNMVLPWFFHRGSNRGWLLKCSTAPGYKKMNFEMLARYFAPRKMDLVWAFCCKNIPKGKTPDPCCKAPLCRSYLPTLATPVIVQCSVELKYF